MKTIKFRQWIGNRFHYWGFSEDGLNFTNPLTINGGFLEAQENSNQFTGLHDKNGVEIYEGDILDYPDCSFSPATGEYDDEISRGEVGWDNEEARFVVSNRMTVDMEDFKWDESEVIGNIYQNPELLEESN